MKKIKNITLYAVLVSLTFMSCKHKAAEKTIEKTKPNVILLLVDDLGYKDVGYMGSKFYETPNIDALAAEGIKFTNAYAAAAICSPTRSSILTGRYPARTGVTDWIKAKFQVKGGDMTPLPEYEENEGRLLRTPSNPYWMENSEVTIAEVLKDEGYFTCHIGKWHLGSDVYYPEKQGFDVNIAGCDFGQPGSYFDPYASKRVDGFPTMKARKKGEYLTDRLSDELANVIQNNKDKPFFINMNYYAVHTPIMGKPELVDKYEAKTAVDDQDNAKYAAMVEGVDHSVGKLLDVLKKENVLDNTIIIFFSDNGGLLGPTSNKPLRSGKGYPYEGGIREPMFVYWKGKIQPGSLTDLPISSVDFLPTICSLTNTPLPNHTIDGRDISKLLNNEALSQIPLYWHFPHYRGKDIVPYSIIRDGDWKLIKRYEGNEFELFNLKDDLGETKDISTEFPGKVTDLNNKLLQWLKDTNAKLPILKN
ncbi:sulfatase [Algibacter amylolyticus]|uniref:Sulfatase n=1 Tax=Algibacter amylolyticus TaxID=1608400 RepID=A0A5M7BCF5_9FLAO|nr:sulfatase [Algibacter amylolyticus]KAA5825144.1 sulfatase [Algibacter amylolyticus]MBB5268748.1 arylsulfatase A-like enzyme [Algibacter amylolyticus]TSJ77638.1 sulfatase [Algibacter amylolyticus]